MAQQIRRFGVLQTAKIVGVLYGVMGLLLFPVFLFPMMLMPDGEGMPFGFALAIAAPVLYGILGFVMAAIGCLVYNMVAGWIGGIEIELE